jgi:hypothetical protein
MDRSKGFVAALICAAVGLLPRAALADEFQDHLDHATVLGQGERYKEALAELTAAYELRQSPRVLYMIAKAQQRLGDAKAALSSYERFLAAYSGGDSDPRFRADAQEQVTQLKHLLGKDVALPTNPIGPQAEREGADVRWEMKPNMGLMAGGAVLFGAAYAAAVISGSIFLEPSSTPSYCGTYTYPGAPACPGGNLQISAGTLLIPILGPFIAAFAYRDPPWSVSWALVDGVAQVGGFAMMVYAGQHPRKVPVFAKNVQVLPFGSAHGGGLRAVGTF